MTDITENGKYYLATKEDIIDGLILELWNYDTNKYDIQEPYDALETYRPIIITQIAHGKCRIKHLDHDDIISLGWVVSSILKPILSHEKTIEGKVYNIFALHEYYYGKNGYTIRIKQDEKWFTVFTGTIRNKSELKRLMNQLGIK